MEKLIQEVEKKISDELPKDSQTLDYIVLALYILALSGLSAAASGDYIYTSELFPTEICIDSNRKYLVTIEALEMVLLRLSCGLHAQQRHSSNYCLQYVPLIRTVIKSRIFFESIQKIDS
ncbi:Hypothetical predicted protein [Octopus vulgaris]|uniref:Uncharacterized protein n=1 Tax=Octopus vulgaris TaxID=6645 RepID=A0AA36B9K8_OCTVU|nr:Hypothetical predicted protein [Octopus vulgaris]